jgi:hypothetical protein
MVILLIGNVWHMASRVGRSWFLIDDSLNSGKYKDNLNEVPQRTHSDLLVVASLYAASLQITEHYWDSDNL